MAKVAADRVEEMRRLRDVENLTLREIGERLGFSKQLVARHLGKVGRLKTTTYKQALMQMVADGLTPAEMAVRLHVKRWTVYSQLKYYGIKIKGG